jgi:hypothetical protein
MTAARGGSSVPSSAKAFMLASALTALAVSAAAGAGAGSPAIQPGSIAGAKLGLGKAAYKHQLGSAVRFEAAGGGDMSEPGFQQPADYARLVFTKRKINIYFKGGVDHAIQITTWNKAYKTKEGIGPCSSLAQLKAAYGKRLQPNPMNTNRDTGEVYSYVVGRTLLFNLTDTPGAIPRQVNAVTLFDGHGPGWKKAGSALAYAGFVASAPDQVPCS